MSLREYTGLWWRPEDPKSTIAGTLRIGDDSRAELKLVGSFREINALQHPFDTPIILGAGEGKLVTLVHCSEIGSQINMPGTVMTRFTADTALLGAHIEEPEALVFDKIYARYEHLETWVNRPGLRRDMVHDEAGALDGFTISYRYPPKVRADVPNATIEFVGGCGLTGNRWDAFVARNTAGVRVIPTAPCSLRELSSSFLHHIQNLLALGAGQPVHLKDDIGNPQRASNGP